MRGNVFNFAFILLCGGLGNLVTASPLDFQLHLSIHNDNDNDNALKFCSSQDYKDFLMIKCESAEASLWNSFSIRTPTSAPPLQGLNSAFNLAARPGSGLPTLQILMSEDETYGVVFGSSTSVKSPFLSGSRRRSTSVQLVFGQCSDSDSDCTEDPIWSDELGYAQHLMLRAVGAPTMDGEVNATCTVRTLDDDFPGLGPLLVCVPGLGAADAAKWRIEVAGSREKIGVSLQSLLGTATTATTANPAGNILGNPHMTPAFCGANLNGHITCESGLHYDYCCVVKSPGSATSWWSYNIAPDAALPLSENTEVVFSAWDGATRIPMVFWDVQDDGMVMTNSHFFPEESNPSTFRLIPAPINELDCLNTKYNEPLEPPKTLVFLISDVGSNSRFCFPDPGNEFKLTCTVTAENVQSWSEGDDPCADDQIGKLVFQLDETECPGTHSCR